MREWFGANTRERDHDGEWTHSDGTPMDEDGHTIYSHTTKEALPEYREDFMVLAKTVADLLAQEEVAIRIDNKMLWFSGDTASVQEEVPEQLKGWVPEAVSARDLSSKEKIHFVLSTLQETSHLLDLFCNQLHYDYANEPLSTRDWPESVKECLATGSEPLLLAEKNGFKIIFAKLAGDKLLRSQERKVIDRLYQEDPTFRGLVVTSDSKEKQWHLVSVKDTGNDANKTGRIFRRLRVGPGQSMRTAVDRLVEIDVEKISEDASGQEIQDVHDKAFDVEAVTKEFYHKISNWYFWALQHDGVVLPRSVKGDAEKSIFFIRMLTRLMFCWFLREKENLVPSKLFEKRSANALLKDSSDEAGTYYKAILQNLFFGTLNQEVEKREFRKPNGNRGATNLYRYANLLNDPSELKDSLDGIPFVNGGLFDCLDEVFVESEEKSNIRLDDFSEEKKNGLCLPNELFFGLSREVDLSDVYDSSRYENERVQGLLGILDQYQFTIEENTPFDQAVALDPELLGKVFENLLASYNEETKTTARKQLGAFYTPREIVDYMVEESLVAYFSNCLQKTDLKDERTEVLLLGLFELDEDEAHSFSEEQVEVLISSIDNLKAIDPAVGSGAFPMGLLHKLVLILGKLDPDNARWKERQRSRAEAESAEAYEIDEQDERERRLSYISQVFEQNSSDYGRKLYLIENCIFGVDIQPIATQIARMRFFISLIVDQDTDQTKPNFGVLPLPNLETKFVTANTLIRIQKPKAQAELFELVEVETLQEKLKQVRHNLFGAKTPRTKNKYRKLDKELRERISDELKNNGWGSENSKLLAAWDPYDQNSSAPYFDPEWMFGVTGFDIVITNPPYVQITSDKFTNQQIAEFKKYQCYRYKADLYQLFLESMVSLLESRGIATIICPTVWMTLESCEPLRKYLLARSAILKARIWGDSMFSAAVVNTMTVILSKDSTTHFIPIVTPTQSFELSLSIVKNDPNTKINFLLSPRTQTLVSKIEAAGTRLERICEVSQGLTPYDKYKGHSQEQIKERCFHASSKLDESYGIWLNGRDIRRWSIKHSGEWLSYGKWLGAPRDERFFQNAKIYCREVPGSGKQIQAALHETESYTGHAASPVISRDGKLETLWFVLAVLNSNTLSWYAGICSPNFSKDIFPKLNPSDIKELPFPSAEKPDKLQLASLAKKCAEAVEANDDSSRATYEAAINKIVYLLFDFSADEINVIENSLGNA